MYHHVFNCIPLCLNLKFQKLYRLAAHDTPTSKKLLKLQLGAISISDIEMVKRKVPLLDSQPFFDGSRLEIFPGQKWSISRLGALFGLGAPEAVLIDFVAGRSLKYSSNGSLTKNVEIP